MIGIGKDTTLPITFEAAVAGKAVMSGADISTGWKSLAPYFDPPAEYSGKLGSYRSPLLFDDGTPVRNAEDWQRRRFSVKPGITCLWQVRGRSCIPFQKWMELDLEYIDKWSLRLDFEILLRTIPAVLKGVGAG